MEDKKDVKNPFASFDFKRFVKQCFKSWKLMGSCVLAVCLLAAAYLYVRQPKSEVVAQMMLPPESVSGGMLQFSELANMLPMGDMFGSSTTENEIAVMGSHSVFERTARELGLNVTYMQKRYPLKWYPAYDDAQLKLTTLPSIPDTIRVSLKFDIDPNDDGTFDITCKYKRRKLADIENAELPVTVETAYGPFTISKTEFFGKAPVNHFRILFCSYNAAAYGYSQAVQIYAPSKKTDFIDLSVVTNDPKFGVKLLNCIIDNYNLLGNKYRDENSTRTLDFVNKRLSTLESQLAQAESNMTKFKKSNSILDPGIDIATVVQKENSFDAQILSVQTELEVIKMAKEFLANPENNYAMLPNVPGAGSQMTAYNELILKRMKLVASAKENNLALRKLNEQIDALRETIISSVDQQYENTKLKLSALRKENMGNDSRKNTVPDIEQEYVSLERDVYLMQQLYVILLKQREEAEMNMMKTSVSLLTIDAPYVMPKAREMSTTIVLAVAIFFGLCLGAFVIIFIKMPKSPLYTSEQIEKLNQLPLMGNIACYPGEDTGIVSVDNRAAEDMRMLRSNVLSALESIGKKVILVTSAANGEGATFIASNLAVAMAKAGFKTTLVEANLRSPGLGDLFPQSKTDPTLADVLEGDDTYTPEFENGKPAVIFAGASNGNPADLLGSEAMSRFVEDVAVDSDYVVIDATHLRGYSDVFAMAEDVDMTLVVSKTGMSTPEELAYVNGLCADGRLPRMGAVINAVAK